MKLKQIGEGYKICPNCKKRTLKFLLSEEQRKNGGFRLTWDGKFWVGYNYECLNCKAKFIDEDKYKNTKAKRT